MIFLVMFLLTVPSVNPHLNNLIETIRRNDLRNADSYWSQYTMSLLEERDFCENTQQLGRLHNIKEHEVKFVEGLSTEAKFCHQIGLEFSKDAMPTESEWFLNKAESLGFVDVTTFFAHARNYAREWNSALHYNTELSDTIESKWREALTKVIKVSRDSADIYRARLELTCIYSPARNTLFQDSLAPKFITNLGNFIRKYPDNPFIEQGYERLVWWLYTAKSYARLIEICGDFLSKYPKAQIAEYIKFQFGNAHYHMKNYDEAKKIFLSINKNTFPNIVYPVWGGEYILKKMNSRLKELEDTN